jgi:hypothetical protein
VRGVALWANTGPFQILLVDGGAPYWTFQDDTLKLTTGDARVRPFTVFGTLWHPEALVGYITYTIGAFCYPNCDGSTTPPVLNVDDFVCFQARFANGDPAANCDHSSTTPALTVLDFVCFLQQFAAGCP